MHSLGITKSSLYSKLHLSDLSYGKPGVVLTDIENAHNTKFVIKILQRNK